MDSWIWSVRLAATRSAASTACRAGHVRVNGVRVKPAHAVRAGDEVRLRGGGRERVVIVQQVITKLAAVQHPGEQFVLDQPGPLRAGAELQMRLVHRRHAIPGLRAPPEVR